MEASSANELINFWVISGMATVFIVLFTYVIYKAISVLHENGRVVEYSFPIFKSMAGNSKTVAAIIIIIMLCGIVWAVNYGG